MTSDKLRTVKQAIALVKPGSRIMVGSFGMAGYPRELIEALAASGVSDLTIISNDLGAPDEGLGKLLTNNQVRSLIGTYYNWNPDVAAANNAGRITVQLVPQGTFAEAIRAAGVGIPAFFTPTAAGTELAAGKETHVFMAGHAFSRKPFTPMSHSSRRTRQTNWATLSITRPPATSTPSWPWRPIPSLSRWMEIVPVGALDPECIVTPHMFVDILTMKGA